MNRSGRARRPPFRAAIAVLALGAATRHPAAEERPAVSIIADGAPGPAAAHGFGELMAALRARGISCERVGSLEAALGARLVIAGLPGGGGPAAPLLEASSPPLPGGPEALLIRDVRDGGRPALLIGGSDDRGLMYGLLEVAERVSWSADPGDPFREVQDAAVRPAAPERAISLYTMNRAYWESRVRDEAYWDRYLDVLARNRFNSLVIIFGYENGGFLAPAYPYFFDMEGFPGVRMVGMTREEQERNLADLRRLIRMAHGHGVRVTIGFWDHIYRGGVQGGGIPGADRAAREPIPGLVWGVTEKNLIPYTRASLARFVQLVPDLDAIQFRMHDESGLKPSEQGAFWRDVFGMMKEAAPGLRLDLRAKGLPDSVIESALEVGIPFRITTKYWMEQMGLPFHPTHINRQNQFDRRHGYADMLRHPKRYEMHWRLWNGGTARVLLWGDPDYARRFVESTRIYGDGGFEVNEPLSTKMEAQPHDARPFDLMTPAHRYYRYEFERYWHFFQVFGRLGYDPDTPPEVWRREFARRFGTDAAPHVEQALHLASWVLPRIVASCYPYDAFPMTRGWAEKQRLGDLPAYARAEGSDIQQFASFDEEAQFVLEGGETAKLRPAANSRWFSERAEAILRQVVEAERRAGSRRSEEFESTLTDLKLLGQLALYHSRRIPAAVSYRLFERTKAPAALEDAITHERSAIEAWRGLTAAAGDFYANDLMMGLRGAGLCGHWKDELTALESGLARLEGQRDALKRDPAARPVPRFTPSAGAGDSTAPEVIHRPVTSAPVDGPLAITAQVRDPSGVKWVRLRHRSVNQHQDYRTLPMLPTGALDEYRAEIPAADLSPTWDLMYFIEAMDQQGNGRIHPDLDMETPYVVVKLVR